MLHFLSVDISHTCAYNKGRKRHCDKRLASFRYKFKFYLNDRHLHWRSLLFTIIVTVYLPICNVIRISLTPFREILANRLPLCSASAHLRAFLL